MNDWQGLDALGVNVTAVADRQVLDELKDPSRAKREKYAAEDHARKRNAALGAGVFVGSLALAGAMLYGTVRIARAAWRG